jgi:hypothetical protein
MKVKTKTIVQVGLHSIVLATALQASAGTITPADPVTAATTISNGGCLFVSATSSFAFTQSRNVGRATPKESSFMVGPAMVAL